MDQKQFLEKAKASGKPTVVDFWAPWCAPCRMTKPVLEKLAGEYKDEVDFWPVNSDEHQGLLQELKIYGIPTVLLIQDGKIAGRFTGAQREDTYRRMFEALAGGGDIQIPISPIDRYLRLGVGTVTVIFAFQASTWWLLALGLLILFSGVYDRCPIWKAITAYFKKLKKTS
ncbi:MAG: thioredoxin family protein [Anaerolineales bacterium]|nr:thioredoxin family protein [Anaerolineales bacterium]